MRYLGTYDIIVVGGGHAGTEAAYSAARMGQSTLLITQRIDSIGQLSCNPSIGGIGKGHLVKEIDAMGGLMAKVADLSAIHYQILNSKKGPAVRATRVQIDRLQYTKEVKSTLENTKNLFLLQDTVTDLIIQGDTVFGVVLLMGQKIHAKSVIIATGTFLNGQIHIGEIKCKGGRLSDASSTKLADRLRELVSNYGRLKTGTPARIDSKTIDFEKLISQSGEKNPIPQLSFFHKVNRPLKQVQCYITKTNERVHDLIRSSLNRSPVYSGAIKSVGPRYCPSIEDKVVRFSDKKSHQIFLEPEGLNSNEIYPNGISTGLPIDVQYDFIRAIEGLENAHITRPGYAIEYDFFDPRHLLNHLESSEIKNLFFAGQINGTTGYEEAAAQGLMAGINAVLRLRDDDPWVPARHEAYIGVMLDDLMTRGVEEPYRMFTSRAEYRLMLREDNADLRLSEKGYQLGLLEACFLDKYKNKLELIEKEKKRVSDTFVSKNMIIENNLFDSSSVPTRDYSVAELIKRPNITYYDLKMRNLLGNLDFDLPKEIEDQVEIQIKYSGYIERQLDEVDRQKKQGDLKIPRDFDYYLVSGLSNEIIQRLSLHRPESVAQASRIYGVTPAAISLILVYLKKNGMYKI